MFLYYNATAELFTEFNFCVLHLEVEGVKFVIYFELKRVLFNFFSGGGEGGGLTFNFFKFLFATVLIYLYHGQYHNTCILISHFRKCIYNFE